MELSIKVQGDLNQIVLTRDGHTFAFRYSEADLSTLVDVVAGQSFDGGVPFSAEDAEIVIRCASAISCARAAATPF